MKCKKKEKYKDKKTAEASKKYLQEKYGSSMSVYYCDIHRCWHIGNNGKKLEWMLKERWS